MLCEYPIYSGSEMIGTACITQEGLYYKIRCRCCLSGEVIYKVMITGADFCEDLGVCVPVDGGFGLCTRIPVKRIAEKQLHFCAVPRHKKGMQKTFAVVEGSPFAYIAKLEKAFLVRKGGDPMIVFADDQAC